MDEDGAAADIVGTKTLTATTLLRPGQWVAGARAVSRGNIQHNTGRRPTQLGATLVIGPGDELLYADFEDYAGDHSDLDEVIAVLLG